MGRRTPTTALLAFAVTLSACTLTDAAPTTTTFAPAATTTSTATTTTAAPTTTESPLVSVTVTGDLPVPLLGELAELYSYLADTRNDRPNVPEAMLTHLAEIDVAPEPRTATGPSVKLPRGDRVGVIHSGEDTLFVVEDPTGWRVVAGHVGAAAPWLGESPRMLLVLGSDARVGENQQRLRADSIHILTTVSENSAGAIVGIPRDSWIEGPDGGIKFSSLMSGRGPEIMLETSRELSGLPLEGYIVTGFKGFTALVTALGGLTIDLPTTMRTGNNWASFPAGSQDLDPNRTLQLARIRKGLPRGDFDRSFNQGLIIQAAMGIVQDIGIDALPMWLLLLLTSTWTDLSTEALLTWAAATYFIEPGELTNIVLPGRVGRVGSASVVFLDEDDVEPIWRDLDDGELEGT